MSIAVKTIKLRIDNKNIRVGEHSVDGKKHPLYIISLGTNAHFQPVFYNSRVQLKNQEVRNHLKWILCHINSQTGEKTYKSWQGKEKETIKYQDLDAINEYADSQLVAINATNTKDVGNFYWLEAFMHYPEFPEALKPKGVYIVFEDAPFVKKACFSRKAYCKFTKAEQTNIPLTKYGETINLFLRTYKLADPSLGYHNYGVFKVTIFSKKKKIAVSEPIIYEQKSKANPDTFLDTIRISMVVEREWRDKAGHEPGTEEAYYAEVEPILAYNTKATEIPNFPDDSNDDESIKTLDKEALKKALEASRKGERYTHITAGNKDMVLLTYTERQFRDTISPAIAQQDLAMASMYMRKELEKFNVRHYFRVPYDTEKEIIAERNNKVGTQMASIKDVEYKCVPNDYSCKFTEISIKDPDREEDVIIFQEIGDGSVDDSTHIPFDIIAGDKKKKELTISLCDLEHEGSPVECLKIGRHHKNAEAVWGMDEAIRQIQWLEEDDVNIDEHVLTLKLMYHYNKTYDTRAQKWLGDALGRPLNKIVDYGWVIRYLDIWNVEKQTYFIPISTCRYPDQKLRIECWPDVEWYVNFKFNTDKPVYVKQSKEYKSRQWDTSADKFKRGGEYGRERSQMKNRASYSLGVDMGIILNGSKQNIGLSNDHPIFRMANFTLMAYEKLNELLQCDLSKTKMNEAANSPMTKRTKRSLPLRIELKRPAFSAGVRARYAVSTTTPQAMGWFIEGVFKASPLFAAEGRLDLLFFAKFIPVAGQVIEGIQKVVDGVNLLTFGAVEIDYYIDLVVGTAVDLSIEDLGYHSVDKWQGPGINLKQSFEIGLEAGGSLELQIGKIEGKGTLQGHAKAKFSVTVAYNDRDQSCPAQFDFEGLEALVYVRFSIKKKKGKKGGGDTPDATPTKVPILSGLSGPEIELFKF